MQKSVLEMIKDSGSGKWRVALNLIFLVLVIVREVNSQVLFQYRILAVAFNDVAYQIIFYGDLH